MTRLACNFWVLKSTLSQTVCFFFFDFFPAQFGCLAWSSNEQFLLYVAEKKLPKAVSYFERQKPSTGKLNVWSLLLYFMFKRLFDYLNGS